VSLQCSFSGIHKLDFRCSEVADIAILADGEGGGVDTVQMRAKSDLLLLILSFYGGQQEQCSLCTSRYLSAVWENS
jgi:hypothetical protein